MRVPDEEGCYEDEGEGTEEGADGEGCGFDGRVMWGGEEGGRG